MSESTGTAAPAAPAPGTGAPSGGEAAPPASRIVPAQPMPRRELSVSEAARLLGEERRAWRAAEGNGATPPARQTPPPAARATPPAPTPSPSPQPAGQPADGGGEAPSIMERLFAELGGERAADDGGGGAPAPTPAPGGQPSTFTLDINGTPTAFTAAQLTEHYHKAQGFTQRMQALADRERELTALQADIDRLKPMLIPSIQRELQALTAGIPENIDWAKLRVEDRERYDELVALKLNAEQETTRLRQLEASHRADQVRQAREAVETGHRRIAEILPSWNEPQFRQEMTVKLRDYALGAGFSHQEMDQLVDPRQFMVLMKAMAFDGNNARIRANGGAPVVPVVRQGAAQPVAHTRANGAQTQEIEQARERAATTGKVNDAARLLTLERQAQQRVRRG